MINFETKTPFNKRTHLPVKQALYGVYSKKELLYIGISWNLKQRFANHHKFEAFVENGATEIRWSEYEDREKLHDDEHQFINECKPKLNVATYRRSTARPERVNINKADIEKLLEKHVSCSKYIHSLLWEYIDSAKTRREAYEQISKDTGISVGWLARFHLKPDFEPGVGKIEQLCVYFTGQTLIELFEK